MNAMDSALLCNQKVASAASRLESFDVSSVSSMLPNTCKEGMMEESHNSAAPTTSLPDKVMAAGMSSSSKSCGGVTLKQRVRDKVGETLLKNNIGSRLAALSSASSVTAAAAALKAGSGRSVASDPEIRPKPLVRSRSEQQDRLSQPSSQEFTKALPKRYASARTSSAPDPDGRVVRDDVFYGGGTTSGRMRPRDMDRLTSLSEHAVPSSHSSPQRNRGEHSATLPSRSAHARIPTTNGGVVSPVRGKASYRRKEPPGTSPYQNHLLSSPLKHDDGIPSSPSKHDDGKLSAIIGLRSSTDGFNVKMPVTPTMHSKLSPSTQSGASGDSSGFRTSQIHMGVAVASTECTASPSRTSQLKEEISASNASSPKSSSPRSANRSSMTLLAAHLEKGGSPASKCLSAQSKSGDRPGRSRSRSRCRTDCASVASSCTQGSQSRRRVQRSVSRGRTGKPSQLAEAGASSAMPRPVTHGRRRPVAAPLPSSNHEKEETVAQDLCNSSGGSDAIEYDFDDGADDLLLGRKPSSKQDNADDDGSVSVASAASGSTSWTPPPRRSNRRSHSVGRVSTKRFDEHGVSWGELPSSSGMLTGPTQPKGRSGCSGKSRSKASCRESPFPEPQRTERRRSLTLADAKVSTLGLPDDSSTKKKRESKIDPTLLIKDIVEASTRTMEEETCTADADKQPSRGIKKSLSGMLRRRPSLSSTSVSSASHSSKSLSSVPSMFAQLLQPGKSFKGEPLVSQASTSGSTNQGKAAGAALSSSSSSSPSVQQALYQNSVTTNESSDESSSSLGE